MAEQVSLRPDALAVVDGDRRLTYRELGMQVAAFARQLGGIGIMPGDRVAVLAPPGLAFWSSFLATTSIGAIWVGLGTRHRRDELRHVIIDSGAKAVLAVATLDGRAYREDLEAVVTPATVLRWFGEDGLLADTLPAQAAESRPLTAAEPALIVYTSGTTGTPKGALLSHGALVGGARAQAQVYADPTPPTQICAFPINHIACVGDTCLTNLVAGGTLVFTPGFDPDEQFALIASERVNVWGGIPTMLMLMLSRPAATTTDMSSVRYIVWGGAAMPPAIVEALGGFGARRVAVYGMTETGCNVTHTPANAASSALAGSIGVPLPEVDIRISHDDGAAGELQIRSPFNMIGYWGREDATRAVFTEDGYLRSGDLGHWNDDGSITLVGRASDMFKSGGFNIYPREVELAIERLPGVIAAAVVAVPDPLYQEVGHGFVMTGGGQWTEAGLRAALGETLANYKCPKRIHLVAALPILPNGKVDKLALRAQALAVGG
ncbi:class I adenylate-forming enzyme family protein [Sandaracinobacteroides saxicola]|uniref:AMP-binding protein n=1 Tax=Sandaracinobacteroides saxicola TaxID=2759707 RepID=A0A7G5IDX7_9SPHN|nr:AMP-binding protein [Sandaracinobacteroides saxicola]QMW21569.1 AMP-binding protein [Sandaracinobacteroides saxicola]